MSAVLAGMAFSLGVAAAAAAVIGLTHRSRSLRRAVAPPREAAAVAASARTAPRSGPAAASSDSARGTLAAADRAAPSARRSGIAAPLRWAAQAAAAVVGLAAGYAASGLWGIGTLAAGTAALGPPFAAAPARRRRHTATALAWQAWARQLAELARSGAGLTDALTASVPHAAARIAPTVERTALIARQDGIDAAARRLAAAGDTFEPDIAAGLRMAAHAGGPVAASLDLLAERIGDGVEVHRARTEAVVALWTQTIALLALAGGVIALMYRNNPAYFDAYRTPKGQAFLVLVALVLVGATAFLVRHSTVRATRSALAPPRRTRRRQRAPL